MADEKKKRKVTAAGRVGKNPSQSVATKVDSDKYRSGGAKPKAKKGAIARKPFPKIRAKKTTD